MERIEARRLVEAAAWRTHLTETESASSEAFEAWLAADTLNRTAWRQVQAPWDFLGEQATSPELIEMRHAALGHAHEVSRRRWLRTILGRGAVRPAIAAGLLIAAIGTLAIWNFNKPESYRTAVGERRTVTMDDGSRIALDARSEVRVSYSAKARDLALIRGQARFDVAHDVERPFSVLAGGQKVVATGTAFNVDLLGSNVLVTLIEGRVVILPREGEPAARRLELNAGEQLVVSKESAPKVTPVSIERATAWQSGQLVFDNEPLSSVVERVKRYSPRGIEIGDAATASMKISGVFNSGDIESFVSTITHYLPVRAEKDERGNIQLGQR